MRKTLESIWAQTFRDYEIVVKDGLSTDGSMEYVQEIAEKMSARASVLREGVPQIRLVQKKDTGIYDAMNQAVEEAAGRYLYFLNCGDYFYEDSVLEKIAELIERCPAKRGIYYGNIYERMTKQVVASNPKMDAFGCYRNVPCHQACFYDKALLLAHPFETRYRVRADYEQFLWCFFQGIASQKTEFIYDTILIADYEGGGFSETGANKRRSKHEHLEIVKKYMSCGKVWKYRLIMWATLAPLRTWIAGNPVTAKAYNRLKKLWYERGRGTK